MGLSHPVSTSTSRKVRTLTCLLQVTPHKGPGIASSRRSHIGGPPTVSVLLKGHADPFHAHPDLFIAPAFEADAAVRPHEGRRAIGEHLGNDGLITAVNVDSGSYGEGIHVLLLRDTLEFLNHFLRNQKVLDTPGAEMQLRVGLGLAH